MRGFKSTLALLVTLEAFNRLGLDRKGIVGLTMPGPGTSARTRMNAMRLMQALGVTAREIPIERGRFRFGASEGPLCGLASGTVRFEVCPCRSQVAACRSETFASFLLRRFSAPKRVSRRL
mgnify:FL=1